jgi:hypothetical protein
MLKIITNAENHNTNVENIFFVVIMTLAWLHDKIITNVENNDFVES